VTIHGAHGMNVINSARTFGTVIADTHSFHKLGLPSFWYLRFHYAGRWCDRIHHAAPEEIIQLSYREKTLRFAITPAYGGALKGIFLDDEYALEHVLHPPPRRILDLGANIGMAAGALAAQFPGAIFLLVEPDPRNLERLEKNVCWNGLHANIVPLAVAAAPGRSRLRIGDDPTCSALETSAMHTLPDMVEAEVTTVADLLRKAGWDSVDLIKIDIEGTEEDLLTQNNGWLARTGAMIVEIHPSCSSEKITIALGEFGLRLQRHGTGREPVYLATRASGYPA
jgi:FkbM family methyltransferase